MLAHLNKLGGAHGIGRVDLVENRYVGMKSRGVYETPGGTILHVAHRGIESLTMDREVLHFRDSLIPRFADLIYNGYWFSPEREMIQASIDAAQKDVTGTARVKLYKGSCTLAGRKSKNSLYRLDIATFEEDDVYNQKDAEGFIRLNALRLKIRAQQKEGLFLMARATGRNSAASEGGKAWGGRFRHKTNRLVESFTVSVTVDRRLYAYDIQGSIAHCKTLGKARVLTVSETRTIVRGLESVKTELDRGRFRFTPQDEDIHMAIERRLTELIGPLGGKLHTGRSRNDQVALDVRLYLRDELSQLVAQLENFQRVLVAKGKANRTVAMPGYTHLQRAQPVLFAHHLLAYVEMIERDKGRFRDASVRCECHAVGVRCACGDQLPS